MSRSSDARRPRRNAARPALESLEGRQVLSTLSPVPKARDLRQAAPLVVPAQNPVPALTTPRIEPGGGGLPIRFPDLQIVTFQFRTGSERRYVDYKLKNVGNLAALAPLTLRFTLKPLGTSFTKTITFNLQTSVQAGGVVTGSMDAPSTFNQPIKPGDVLVLSVTFANDFLDPTPNTARIVA